jgi:hypothetical protein
MTPIACPRCQGKKWHATGRITMSRRNLPRAVLVCEAPGCGFTFSSGLKPALDAAAAERGDCELTPTTESSPPAVIVPQPSLPMENIERQHQGFVSTGELARRAIAADFKRRAGGE